jgi:GNAT superfamily N-acetyltransferase
MKVTIRPMTAADIPVGMKLKEQNLWNTLPEDWRRQLDLEPEGCFVAEAEGAVVGTACACIFDTVAWVNLVLVDKIHRGRGIGTSLMRTVLAWLDDRKVPSIRLDATPLGRPIYEKLGFAVEYELTRYEGTMPRLAGAGERVVVAQASDLSAVIQLDRAVTGTNRSKLIRYLCDRLNFFVARDENCIAGCAAFRPGSRARHIGPCLGDAPACRELLATISQFLHGDVIFMDIPVAHAEANAFAAQIGLTAQRGLARMGRGVPVREDIARMWCSFGPEKG